MAVNCVTFSMMTKSKKPMQVFHKICVLLVAIMLSSGLIAQGEIRMSNPGNEVADPALQDLELAKQYYEKGEYAKALTYLEKLQRRRTKQIYSLSLDCYLALKDYRKAENLVSDYIKNIRGNNASYYADMVYVLLEQDKQSKVDKFVAGLLKKVESNPGLAHTFGDAFQRRGFPKIALDIYETAERMVPSSSFDYQKALLYGELGDIKLMYATYVDMVEHSPAYIRNVKQFLGRALAEEGSSENADYLKQLLIERIQKNESANLYDLLIFVFIQEKNFNGAFIQLKALDKRNKGNKSEIFNLGRVALNNSEYALTQRIFGYVINAGPDYPFYESALAMDLEARKLGLLDKPESNQEDWKTLQKEYFKVLKIMKGQPEAGSLVIGLSDLSAFHLGQADTAIGMLKGIISTGYISEEDIARAKIKLGDILLYNGNRWDAILYYGQAEKAFEQSPIGQEAKFKRAKAAYYVGDFQWAQGIFDALKASTSKLIANDAMSYAMLINDNVALDTNTEAMSMYARADLMNYQNKYDSAIRLLDMMDIAFPEHEILDEVFLLKSKILTQQKKYDLAVEPLESIVDLYSDGILADDALYALAQLYELYLNDTEKAKELYQKLFTEHPDSFFTSDARKRFRVLRGDVLN